MLTEVIMHDCIVKLLKNHDEESLECLCRLLSTIGKDLDFEKAKVPYPNVLCRQVKFEFPGTILLFVLSRVWTSISIRWRRS